MNDLKNWAGNYEYRAARVRRPDSVAEVQEWVSRSTKVKALGTRHSFNSVADTSGDLISTEKLNAIVSLDETTSTVTIQGGVRYGELCSYLQSKGYALHNLASLPHISVVGACATGTHGSGNGSGVLATSVRALSFVKADGQIEHVSLDDDRDRFLGAVVGLGALGVVVEMSLAIEPTFEIAQTVYEWLPFASMEAHFEEIEACAYSVSLFTDWQTDRINQVWLKTRIEPGVTPSSPESLFGAKLTARGRHPIGDLSAIHCTEQLGVPGPWHERLPHFRLDFTPSSGEELQTEFLVPRSLAVTALQSVGQLADRIAPLLQVCEVRTVAADELWMSPAYMRDSVAIHFTWKQDWPQVSALLPLIEAQLSPFEARPHWGKLFTMGEDRLKSLYPRLGDFRHLAKAFDPTGKFRNEFLDTYVLD